VPGDASCGHGSTVCPDENTPPLDVAATQDLNHRRVGLKAKATGVSGTATSFLSKSFVTARKALDAIKIETQLNNRVEALFTRPKVLQGSVIFQKSPWMMDKSPAAADAKSVEEFYVFATSNTNGNFRYIRILILI
jgi:hypothetical protein